MRTLVFILALVLATGVQAVDGYVTVTNGTTQIGAGPTANQINSLFPSDLLTNGYTPNVALGGGLTNNSAAGFSGNGRGITNVWTSTLLSGSWNSGNLGTGSRYIAPNGTASANAANLIEVPVPYSASGCYLTNLQFFITSLIPATTNITLIVQTNTPEATPVDGLLTCVMAGGTGVHYTNDTVHSVIFAPGTTNMMVMRLVSSQANVPPSFTWTMELWHQSP